jgi:WD40 repeat protein
MIEEAPLQLYHSAIVFAPSRSMVRQKFMDEIPRWLSRLPATHDNWREEVLIIEGHSGWVDAVAFSPDGLLIASPSDDKTVKA